MISFFFFSIKRIYFLNVYENLCRKFFITWFVSNYKFIFYNFSLSLLYFNKMFNNCLFYKFPWVFFFKKKTYINRPRLSSIQLLAKCNYILLLFLIIFIKSFWKPWKISKDILNLNFLNFYNLLNYKWFSVSNLICLNISKNLTKKKLQILLQIFVQRFKDFFFFKFFNIFLQFEKLLCINIFFKMGYNIFQNSIIFIFNSLLLNIFLNEIDMFFFVLKYNFLYLKKNFNLFKFYQKIKFKFKMAYKKIYSGFYINSKFFFKDLYFFRYDFNILLGFTGFFWETLIFFKHILYFLNKFFFLNIYYRFSIKCYDKLWINFLGFSLFLKKSFFFTKKRFINSQSFLALYPSLILICKRLVVKQILKFKKKFKPTVVVKLLLLPFLNLFEFFNYLFYEILKYFQFCFKKQNLWFLFILLKKSCGLTILFKNQFKNLNKNIYIFKNAMFIFKKCVIFSQLLYPKNFRINIFYFHIWKKNYFYYNNNFKF